MTSLEIRKGRPFLEIFASALNEDYRFPILEVFAFLYALGTFIFANFSVAGVGTGEGAAFLLTSSILGFPLFIFVILIFKNLAFGLGNDLEKGVIQTFLSYPIKRRWILSAKLLSALGVATLLLIIIPTSALYILAPGVVGPNVGTVILTFVATISESLLIGGIVLLVTLLIKRGAVALVLGIVLFFALGIVGQIVLFSSFASRSALGIQIFALINPNQALNQYYASSMLQARGLPFDTGTIWTPSFSEALSYIVGAYVIVAAVYAMAYFYFSRRLNL